MAEIEQPQAEKPYEYHGLQIAMPESVIAPMIQFFESQAQAFGAKDVPEYVKGILSAQFSAQLKAKKSVASDKLSAINTELATQKTVVEYLGGITDALKRFQAAFGAEFKLTNLTDDSVKGTAATFPIEVPIFAQRKGFSVSYVDTDGDDAYEIRVPLTGDMILKRDALKQYAVEFIEGQLGRDIPFAVTLDKDGKVVGVLQDMKSKESDGEKTGGTRSQTKTVIIDGGRGEETETGKKLVEWLYNKGVFTDKSWQDIEFEATKAGSSGTGYGWANLLKAERQKKYGFRVWSLDENRNRVPFQHDTPYPFGNK